jgi:hypothetical protein
MKKIDPAPLSIWSTLPSWDGINTDSRRHFYDLSQMASLVNRRFYRQGLNWAVGAIKIHFPEVPAGITLATTPAISVSKLPNTWIMFNAWKKGFETWQKMNREAMTESESIRPRFLDFKIYANDIHHSKGFALNNLPVGYTAGEWLPSKFVIPKTDGTDTVHNREVLAVGANYPPAGGTGLGAVSLIEGYAAGRALPYETDPNVPVDAASVEGDSPQNWMQAVFNEGTQQDDQVMNDMITENNEAPYPYEGDGTHTDTMYPGGANQAAQLEIHAYKAFAGATVGNMITIEGGNFPCGLIEIDNPMRYVNEQSQEVELPALVQFCMVPGPHRGYMAESMLEA